VSKKRKPAKKRARLRTPRRSRAPFLMLCLAVAAVAGVLIVQNPKGSPDSPDSVSVDTGVSTTVGGDPTTDASNESSNPSSTGDSAPPPSHTPVTVHNDTLGDIAGDTVIDDYTEVAPPDVVDEPLMVDPALYAGDRIDGVIPDGVYHARVFNTFDEELQGVNFDIPSEAGGVDPHLYPAFLDQLIFVSIPDAADSSTSVSVSPATFFALVSDDSSRVENVWFQITVVDGAVIAAEAFTPR